MQAPVTEKDLQRFAALGFAAPVHASKAADAEELSESVVHVLMKPSARLVNAAALALKELASTNELDVFSRYEFSDDMRRRLGYIAERLSQQVEPLSSEASRLQSFAQRLERADDRDHKALVLMATVNPTLLRLKKKRADKLSRRWNVYGDISLPKG